MRILSWIRARYESAYALHLARYTRRQCDELHDRLGDTDFRAMSLRHLLRDEIRRIAGPSPASDGLSLAVLREQICRTEQRICNAHASIQVLRDTGDAQARKIAELQTQLGDMQDKFSSRTDVMSQPSLN